MVSESNVVYHKVFPTLITQATLDLDVERMASDILKVSETLDSNYSGGYTSYREREAIHGKFRNVYGVDEVFQSIRKLYDCCNDEQHFIPPAPPKVYGWINVMTKGGHHRKHNHYKHSYGSMVYSGTFYIRWLPGMSQIRFFSPLETLKEVEPDVFPPGDHSVYNIPSFTVDTPPNTLLMWPSWLNHEVPEMLVDGPRITLSYNVYY